MTVPSPLIAKGSGGEPFFYPYAVSGVMNQLIIGPTNAGKSVLIGALVSAATALPNDSRILWLDIDKSSWIVGHALGAVYQEPGNHDSAPLCPFTHIDRPEGLSSILDWFLRLFLRWGIDLSEVQTADLTRALGLLKIQPHLRSMTVFADLIQDVRMRGVLANYTSTWKHIFDGRAAIAEVPLQVYELRSLISLGPRAYGPAIEIILNDASVHIHDKRPMLIYHDEANHTLKDPIGSRWLHAGIRECRKFGAGIVLATQAIADIANSPDCELLIESCPGKVWLPNPEAKGEYVRDLYRKLGLSDRKIDIIAEAIPQREYIFDSPQGCRKFQLNLGPVALKYIANTSRLSEDRQLITESR
jgi:type IV secretory pathway VirB4 component